MMNDGPEFIIGNQVNGAAAATDDLGDFDDFDAFPNLEEGYEDEEDSWDESPAVTAVTIEKEFALVVIGDILTHTGRDYLSHVKETIENVKLLAEHFYTGVRRSAVVTLLRTYALMWDHQGEQASKWEPGLPLKVRPSDEIMRVGDTVMQATLHVWQYEEDRYVTIQKAFASFLPQSMTYRYRDMMTHMSLIPAHSEAQKVSLTRKRNLFLIIA